MSDVGFSVGLIIGLSLVFGIVIGIGTVGLVFMMLKKLQELLKK